MVGIAPVIDGYSKAEHAAYRVGWHLSLASKEPMPINIYRNVNQHLRPAFERGWAEAKAKLEQQENPG